MTDPDQTASGGHREVLDNVEDMLTKQRERDAATAAEQPPATRRNRRDPEISW